MNNRIDINGEGSMKEWYLKKLAKVHGPYSKEDVFELLSQERIGRDSLIKRGRDGDWVRLHTISHLFKARSKSSKPDQAPRINPQSTKVPEKVDTYNDSLIENPRASSPAPIIAALVIIPVLLLSFVLVLTASKESEKNDRVSDSTNSVKPNESIPIKKKEEVSKSSEATTPASSTTSMSTEELVKSVESLVALIRGTRGSGTGFMLENHILVTNKHVIDDEIIESLKIFFPSESGDKKGPFTAKLIYEDPELDIAFLQMSIQNTRHLKLLEQYSLRKGQDITLIGNPGGLDDDDGTLENAVTKGVMSAETVIGGRPFYQMSIAVNGGNSGGPVFDVKGDVLGIVTLKAINQEGHGFCIPAKSVKASFVNAKLSDESKWNEVNRLHRIKAVFRCIDKLSEVHIEGMKIYQSAMQDALNNNMDVNVGLNTVRTKVQEGLKKYRRYNFGDIERDIVRIQSDNLIQSNVKEKFNDLKSNFEEIQDYVDNPRGNYESYSKKIVEFTDNYKKTSKTMKVLLGMELDE